MSDRRLIAVVALLALGSAASLPAQQNVAGLDARRAALRVRVDSLRTLTKALEAAERDSGLVEEVRIGQLRVRTTATLKPLATEAFTRVMNEARQLIGVEADSLAGRMQLTLREQWTKTDAWKFPLFRDPVPQTPKRLASASLEAMLDGREQPGFQLRWPVLSEDLAMSALGIFERAAADSLPRVAERWLNHRLPLRAFRPDFWPELYRTLATSGAAAVRRCVGGDRAACTVAFTLDSMPADRLAAWYDEPDWPTLARTAGDFMQRDGLRTRFTPDEQKACTERAHRETCRQMLALLPQSVFGIPMPDAARGSLTRVALETGGPTAVTRLRADTGHTVGQQLAAAAGVPEDSLVGIWQRRLIAARPASPLPGATFVLASLACIAVCGTLAIRGQPWK